MYTYTYADLRIKLLGQGAKVQARRQKGEKQKEQQQAKEGGRGGLEGAAKKKAKKDGAFAE